MKTPFSSACLNSLFAAFSVCLLPSIASAASGTWTGATNGTWQENSNWTGASFPNGNGEIATFNGAGNGNTTISLGGGSITLGNFGINGIVFDTSVLPSYTVGNGTINTIQGGNIIRLNPTVSSNQTVSAAIVTDSQSILYTTENIINLSPSSRLTLGNLSVLGAASGTGSTNYSFRGLGDITVAGAITDNTSGGAPRLTAVANHRSGTLTLSGSNSFSGAFNGGDTPQSLSGGFGGTVVLDYSGGNTVLTSGTSLTPGRGATGNLVLKGNTTGTTSLTPSSTQRLAQGYSSITVDRNGGSGTTLVLGRTWTAWNSAGAGRMVHFDLSSGGLAQVTDGVTPGFTGGGYRVDRALIADTVGGRRSIATVKGTDDKTYFATLDSNGFIVAQTTLTTMPSSGSPGFSTNLQVTSNTTVTGAGEYAALTLRIEGASANQSVNMGGRNLNMGGAILMDGPNDFTLTNYSNLTPSSGVIVMGTGKLTLAGTRSSANDFDKFGPGLLEVTGNHSGSTGATLVWGGTYRAETANALTAGNLTMADSVLELGYNFTRALGSGSGQVQGRRDDSGGGDNTLGSSFGFSAYGADRTVNLGGSGGTVTFGTGGFVTSRNAKFLLSSTTSDSMVDFQNPLNLAGDVQTIEVRNGSSAIDARLSGVISNGSLNKTGTGTLELTATNTYTGTTVVNAGTLLVNGSLANTTTLISSGAVLGGSGTIGGATTVVGSLRPGNSIGTLNITNDVTWNSSVMSDAWVFELGAAGLDISNPGSSDLLNITGSFLGTPGNLWAFDFAGSGAVGWYKLVDWTVGTSFSAGDFTATNLASGLTGSFTVDNTTSALYLQVIPEPSSALLILSALGVFLLARRKRIV